MGLAQLCWRCATTATRLWLTGGPEGGSVGGQVCCQLPAWCPPHTPPCWLIVTVMCAATLILSVKLHWLQAAVGAQGQPRRHAKADYQLGLSQEGPVPPQVDIQSCVQRGLSSTMCCCVEQNIVLWFLLYGCGSSSVRTECCARLAGWLAGTPCTSCQLGCGQ